jgi:hypothetical protein
MTNAWEVFQCVYVVVYGEGKSGAKQGGAPPAPAPREPRSCSRRKMNAKKIQKDIENVPSGSGALKTQPNPEFIIERGEHDKR